MRQQKKLEKLGPDSDKSITILEASVEYILSQKEMKLFSGEEEQKAIKEKGLFGLLDVIKPIYDELTDGLPFDELRGLFPSELKLIWDTFKEVNAVFFGVVQDLGLIQILDQIISEIKSDLSSIFIDLSKEAIQDPGNMGSDGS